MAARQGGARHLNDEFTPTQRIVHELGPATEIVSYQNGQFLMTTAPRWWAEEAWLSGPSSATSLEVGPLGLGMLARRAPEGLTVCLVGNDESQDVTAVWCPTDADYLTFMCGPGALFASACAHILAADPLKKGIWR